MTQMEREVILVLVRGLRNMADELEMILSEKNVKEEKVKVADKLKDVGFSCKFVGFGYLIEAIEIQTGKPSMQLKTICAEIGKRHNLPETTIQSALNELFNGLSESDKQLVWKRYRADTPRAFIRSFIYNNR